MHWPVKKTWKDGVTPIRYLGTVNRNDFYYDVYVANDLSFWCYHGGGRVAGFYRKHSFNVIGTSLNQWFKEAVEPLLKSAQDPSISPNATHGAKATNARIS